MSGKGHRHCVDPGAIVEEVFKPDQPDFQKASVGHLKIPTHFSLLELDEQKRWTIKISLALGYISYDATTFPWVTFSYELTGFERGIGLNAAKQIGVTIPQWTLMKADKFIR
jgi:hypothetical protein